MRRAVLPSLPWVYVFFLSFLESLPRRGAAAAGLLCGLQPSERRDSTVPPSSLKEERGRRGGPHSPTQEGPPGRCSVLCIARRVPWNPGWLSFPFYQKPSVPRAGQTSRILGRAAPAAWRLCRSLQWRPPRATWGRACAALPLLSTAVHCNRRTAHPPFAHTRKTSESARCRLPIKKNV